MLNQLKEYRSPSRKIHTTSFIIIQNNINSRKKIAVLTIPEVCAEKIITLYHSSLFAGLQGVIKTHLTISNKFFIPNLIHYL